MNLKFRILPAPAAVCLLAGFLSISFLSIIGPAELLALDTSPILKSSEAKQKKKRKPHTSGPILSPANPAVTPGNSISFTSTGSVTWSLQGVGTLSGQTSNSVVYTAPPSVVPQNQMLGCQVLPDDTVFNTPVNSLPLDPNSAAMISTQSPVPLSFEPSWGISYADNSTPTRTFLSFYDSITHPNFVFPNQGVNMRREAGDFVGIFSFGANRPDHHVMTVKRTDCTFYESYDDYTNGYLRTCNDGTTPNCNVQSAVNYAATTYNFNDSWGTDAGGFLLAPLVWHVDEIKSGSINHAVRFTEGLGGILGGVVRWPASATAGGCDPNVCPNAMPMGTRLRLQASYDIGTFSPTAQTMLAALQKYGMILTDTGSNNGLQVASDVSDDPTVMAAFTEIGAHLTISNFEVVDESSLQFAAFSYAVCPMNTTCLGAQNTFVQPLNQAMITATPASGAATSVPIALQGIAIGLGVPPVLPVQAGSYSFQIPFWVNGTSNQSVNWTLQSGAGAVTAAGLYTPPANTTGIGTTSAAVVQGTSAADPNVSTNLYLTILPAGASPTGSIRIDTGSTANTIDGNSNVWLPDSGIDGALESFPSDYPNWKTTDPLRPIYQSAAIAYGNELHYTFALPNGNYRVHLLFGALQIGCTAPCGTWPGSSLDTHSYNPQMLETQGIFQNHYFDWGLKAGYSYATPVDTYIPAKVTNNILELGVYALAPDAGPVLAPVNGNKLNSLNGVEILPDASSPHWTVDTQQQTSISSGQTLRAFYVTDWYTGVNDPTWSIVSGPAGATLTGSTLTLAAGTYLNAQPIIVNASDGTYSATATIYTAGGTAALGILVAPKPASHYSYKRAITINHTQVTANQTNFPVTISITDPTLENVTDGGHVQQTKGYDIMLASDAAGANPLTWEVEKYDPAAGTWIAHVKVPALSSTADSAIYMFYGNPAVTADQSNAAGVWDANFTGVYHMANLTTSTVGDSTSHANNALVNVQVGSARAGEIGPAASFAGTLDHFELPAAVLNPGQGTVSAWIDTRQAAVSGQNWVTAAQVDSSNVFNFAYWTSYFNATIFGWENQGTDYRVQVSNSVMPLPVGTWQQVAYTWNQATSTQVVYLNGVAISTVTTPFTPYTPAGNFWVGAESSNQSYVFGGLMDELRLSNINRPATWIAAEFASQRSPGTFSTLGAESGN
jgi:hypothetical protein